jgi:hypothetical protein
VLPGAGLQELKGVILVGGGTLGLGGPTGALGRHAGAPAGAGEDDVLESEEGEEEAHTALCEVVADGGLWEGALNPKP